MSLWAQQRKWRPRAGNLGRRAEGGELPGSPAIAAGQLLGAFFQGATHRAGPSQAGLCMPTGMLGPGQGLPVRNTVHTAEGLDETEARHTF